MECHDIREKMSAFIDGYLSPDERAAVEKHLGACVTCRSELAGLRKTVQLLGNLEEVAPPRWLTQKTMSRIKAEERRGKGILRKLFFPLHVKLPLEAVAVVMIAVVSIYVFRMIPPEIKQEPGKESAVTAPTPADPQPSPTALPKPQKVEAPRQREPQSLPPDKPSENARLAGEAKTADSLAETTRESFSVKKDEKVMLPAPAGIGREEQSMPAVASAPRAKEYSVKQSAGGKDDASVLTLSVANMESSVAEIEKELKLLGGRIHRKELMGRKTVLNVELDHGKFRRLYERLRVIGEIREKESDFSDRPGDLRLKIEILSR